MEILFENKDFVLKSTGHDYDFVGIIETKTDKPLTFFFEEELFPAETEEEEQVYDYEPEAFIDESATKLLEVYENLADPYDEDDDCDEVFDVARRLGTDSFFRTRDDKSTGFLSDPRQRGQFLALIKNYCPEKLDRIAWA